MNAGVARPWRSQVSTVALLVGLAGALGGCSGSGTATSSTTVAETAVDTGTGSGTATSTDSATGSTTATDTASATSSAGASSSVVVSEAWVKAVDAKMTMTSVFGVLKNTSTADVTITAAATTASKRAEIHEMAMVNGTTVMRKKAGGLVIPAGGSAVLAPGGDHLMILDLTKPVQAGDDVTVTLTLADGSTVQFKATAKPFTGANETYRPGDGAVSAPPVTSPSASKS